MDYKVQKEIRQLLKQSAHAIQQLRCENEILNAQQKVVNTFAIALSATPPTQDYTSDIVPDLIKMATQLPPPGFNEDDTNDNS